MHQSPKRHLLLPLLAIGMALAMATAAYAQDAAATLQVTFGASPHWSTVRGTHVREIRENERPGYDMFRYGGSYYAYNNNRWYMSRRGQGQFNAIDDRAVPSELSKVPREHWHHYPDAWSNENGHANGQPRNDRDHH